MNTVPLLQKLLDVTRSVDYLWTLMIDQTFLSTQAAECAKKIRCLDFPNCAKDVLECLFTHPVTECKDVFQCTYGPNLCLFLHPICKFESFKAGCKNNQCPFMHVLQRKSMCKDVYSCVYGPSQCSFWHPDCKFEETADRKSVV